VQKASLLDDEELKSIGNYRQLIWRIRRVIPEDFPASIYTINRYSRYLLNSRLDDGEVFIPFEKWWWIKEFLSDEVYSLAMQCNALEVKDHLLKSRFQPTELRVVNLLMANYGDMVRKERIKEELWGDNADTYGLDCLTTTRSKANKVLAELGTRWRIKNIYNTGSELVLSESNC
jgi:hypothetical protein